MITIYLSGCENCHFRLNNDEPMDSNYWGSECILQYRLYEDQSPWERGLSRKQSQSLEDPPKWCPILHGHNEFKFEINRHY